MVELLGTVKLRNQYLIYQEDHGYRVEQIDRNGQTHSVEIPQHIVDYLYHALKGSRVEVKQAEDVLQGAPESVHLHLPYMHGYKLQFYAQDVLLVLVALKKATHMEVNRKFFYTVGP